MREEKRRKVREKGEGERIMRGRENHERGRGKR